MSQLVYFSSAGSSGANQTLDNTYDSIGFGTNGDGTLVTADAAGNAKGSFVSLGTAAADWAGFFLWVGTSTSSATKYLVDVRAGLSTVIAPNLYVHTGSTTAWRPIYIPLNVTSATELFAAIQANSTGGQSLRFGIIGVRRNSQSPPLFSSMVALSADTANTRASTIDVPLTDVWTQQIASTSAAYAALMVMTGMGASNPATAQSASVSLGTGGSGSEAAFYQYPVVANTTDPRLPGGFSGLIERAIPAGTRLSAKIKAATTGDNFRVGLYGLVA
ncbi:MAG TPA: hypothetical protein VIO94_16015 [Phenylobacterium sp.]